MDRVKRIVNAILRPVYQPAMRLTRGQTLGARCAVLDHGRLAFYDDLDEATARYEAAS